MAHGGKRENAGRKKGEPNKKSRLIEEILETLDCSPIEILAEIASGKRIRCGVGLNKAGDDLIEDDVIPSLDQRLSACKELAQYVYPKRKAIEHSGDLNHTHEHWIDGITPAPEAEG